MTEIAYTVPEMSCGHGKAAVSSELEEVAGVESADVDLDTKVVIVRGSPCGDRRGRLRDLIDRGADDGDGDSGNHTDGRG
jgi:copper chaperone CopZ